MAKELVRTEITQKFACAYITITWKWPINYQIHQDIVLAETGQLEKF